MREPRTPGHFFYSREKNPLAGRNMAESLSAEAIQTEAETRANIADPERDRFAGNLRYLVEALNGEANLSPVGRAIAHQQLVVNLSHRLETIGWVERHPEIAAEPIERPIFLTGLPRSGTTFFQYLFDRDAALRLIRTWEANAPCPPPALDAGSVASRISAETLRSEEIRAFYAGLNELHLTDPEGPEECHNFLAQSFAAAGFHNMMRVPAYFDALLDRIDLADAYRVHRRQLQLLQWRAPRRRWALKYPNHVLGLEAIRAVFPAAALVMTHRDPVQTLASICKLTCSFRRSYSDTVDPHSVGRDMFHFIHRHIDRIMAFDATPAGETVVHVDYYRLIDAPARVLAEVYARLDMVMPPSLQEDVADWHRRNPKGARGNNRYALDQFGLDAGAVAESFGAYMKRFDIPREARGLLRQA
jgi:hypothetical protein